MDYTNNNYGYGNTYGYGYAPYAYGYNPNGQAMMYNNNMAVPSNKPSLTSEEAAQIKNKPMNVLNLQIDPLDLYRGLCNHIDPNTGQSVVQIVQDGSGDAWCPICGSRWDATPKTKEEVEEMINNIISQMENCKWVGDLPTNVIREYFAMVPLLKKFPDLYEFGIKNFNRYMGANAMYSAQDANIYAQYNSLFGPGYGYGAPMYQQMPQQPNFYGQPIPQQEQQPQMATGVNPMQSTAFTPQANQAVQPQPAGFNPQFANQAGMMMQGNGYYNQPISMAPQYMQQMKAMGYNPQFGAVQQPQQAQQVEQPKENKDAKPVVESKSTKIDL